MAVLPKSGEASRRRLIAFGAQREDTVVVGQIIVEDFRPGPVQVQHVPNAYLLPASRPGVYFEDDGTARAAVLFERDREPHDLLVAELEAGRDYLDVRRLAELPSAPRAGAAAYTVGPQGARRFEWVVLLDGEDRAGTVISSIDPGRGQHLGGTPVRPLVLLPLSQATYLLVVDGDRGPQWRALE